MEYKDFIKIIKSGAPLFLCGIGGVSMRALAGLLQDMGACVQGSDRELSDVTDALCAKGIKVYAPQKAENIADAALIIRTAAVTDENPEIIEAKNRGITVMERSEAWGLLMNNYKKVVCIAGTHGKTTTTAMAATLGIHAKADPTVMVGGDMPAISGTLRIGSDKLMIAEACEYKNSFLRFFPTVAVILNVEYDHPDFFPDEDAVIAAFREFALRTPQKGGTVIYRGDDKNACKAVLNIERKLLSFGLSENCEIRAENVVLSNHASCNIIYRGKRWAHIELPVAGEHNILNALACAAIAITLGFEPEDFENAMSVYRGVGRRMEYIRSYRGADIYDDYAHHPSEIEATLKTAKQAAQKRVLCVFQPHTYSRTKALLPDFAKALGIADKVLVCPIFAAREKDDLGISAQTLADMIENAEAAGSLKEASRWIEENACEGDLILTMGAGDVYKSAFELRSENMRIISVREEPEYKTTAINYFKAVWKDDNNRRLFENSISYSLMTENQLPRYYLLEDGDEIIGCASLITNDYISRQDLLPWISKVYIAENMRGHGLGAYLLDYARRDAKKAGFDKVYIATANIGYYEHFGFKHIGMGYHPWGENSRIYEGSTDI